jgi:hypothetical protein
MAISELEKYDLRYSGNWISGSDRDLAFETHHMLNLMEDEFICAVASYSMFVPITIDDLDCSRNQSKYIRYLNCIYAKSFVYSLDSISKILDVLVKQTNAPNALRSLVSQYELKYGHLKHIRDSAAHIEDRGRALDRNLKKIPSKIIVLGSFNERRFEFTGSDGKCYGVDISESTLLSAHEILQAIINAYNWE